MKDDLIPLSDYAEHLSQDICSLGEITTVSAIISFIVGLMGLGITALTLSDAHLRMPGWIVVAWLLVLPLIVTCSASLIYLPFFSKKHKTKRSQMLKDNEEDYHRSQGLQAAIESIKLLNPADPETCPMTVEQTIPGQWVPYRVEHCLSYTTRSSLASDFGAVVPQLFESSSIVFCHDVENTRKTLRVLVPSPSVIKDRLVRIIKGSKEKHEICGRITTDHTDEVIDKFSVEDEQLLEPLIHPNVIDAIDASCQQPLEKRPILRIKAVANSRLLSKGVAIAGSIALDNEPEAVFYPSGFFALMSQKLMPYLRGDFEKGPALEAVGVNNNDAVKQITSNGLSLHSSNEYSLDQFNRKLLFQGAETE